MALVEFWINVVCGTKVYEMLRGWISFQEYDARLGRQEIVTIGSRVARQGQRCRRRRALVALKLVEGRKSVGLTDR